MSRIKAIAFIIQFGIVLISLYGLKELAGDLHWSIELVFGVFIFATLDTWCAIRDKE